MDGISTKTSQNSDEIFFWKKPPIDFSLKKQTVFPKLHYFLFLAHSAFLNRWAKVSFLLTTKHVALK